MMSHFIGQIFFALTLTAVFVGLALTAVMPLLLF
jgi:multisubunit Na+/H+ antiporter MnhC subunit